MQAPLAPPRQSQKSPSPWWPRQNPSRNLSACCLVKVFLGAATAVGLWVFQLLGGIHAGEWNNYGWDCAKNRNHGAKSSALFGQRIVGGFIQIPSVICVGSAAHLLRLLSQCEFYGAYKGNQRGFAFNAVDAIHHRKLGFNQGSRFSVINSTTGVTAVGVYRHNALGQRLHFQLANVACQGMNLAVGVGDANVVHINQSERANARAR